MPYHEYEHNFGNFEGQQNTDSTNNKFLSENCLVALLCTSTLAKTENRNVDVRANDFDNQFGREVGDALRRIGCDRVRVDGDQVRLHLTDTYYENVNQGPLGRIRLSPDISLRVTRDGNGINISDVSGVHLDFGRAVPWVGLPNMRITDGNAAVRVPVYGDLNLDLPQGSFEQLNQLLRRVGR